MDLKEIVAANLRRIRHAKKITQEELADRVGLSSRYIGSVERGAASPTVTVLGKLADALGIEAGVLVSKKRTG
jgi:transcriptional regulator with XRE-family HTH domain